MAESQASGFRYTPLDLSKQQILLVMFTTMSSIHYHRTLSSVRSWISWPERYFNDETVMVMHIADIDQNPSYTALSYTWGSPSPTLPVLLYQSQEKRTGQVREGDGALSQSTGTQSGYLHLRENLSKFLSVMNKEYFNQYFWIDQICIDQTNENEKNHQVQFMGDIFRNASSVVAWLGETEGLTDGDSLQYLQNHEWTYTNIHGGFPPASFCNSLRAFLGRDFWTRLWIIQEVVLARRLEFLCGPFRISWRGLGQLADPRFRTFLSSLAPELEVLRTYDSWCSSFFQPLDAQRADQTQTLFRVLMRFYPVSSGEYRQSSVWKCEIPQDEVYGLLGLVSPEERLKVDYSKSNAEMRKEAWHTIMSRRITEAVGSADFDDTEQMAKDLFNVLGISLALVPRRPGNSRDGTAWPPGCDFPMLWNDISSSARKISTRKAQPGRYRSRREESAFESEYGTSFQVW